MFEILKKKKTIFNLMSVVFWLCYFGLQICIKKFSAYGRSDHCANFQVAVASYSNGGLELNWIDSLYQPVVPWLLLTTMQSTKVLSMKN